MFTVVNQQIGPLYPGDSITLEFPYEGIHIKEMKPSCGCSEPTNILSEYKKGGKVVVVYTAQPFPIHLIRESKFEHNTTKHINIDYYEDGKTEIKKTTIQFTANVKRRL